VLLSDWLEPYLAPYWWPRTVEGAADRVLARLGSLEQARLRASTEKVLAVSLYFLELSIRNDLVLWTRNRKLLADCGGVDAATASGIILRRVLQRLRGGAAGPGAPDPVA
jgi:hypothetical protein